MTVDGPSHSKDGPNMSGRSRPFRVALIQMRCSTDPEDNLRRPRHAPSREIHGRPQVACLPELFRTQYFCQVEEASRFDLAEPIPGPTTEALASVARERHGDRRLDLREAHGGRLSQHGGRPRRRRDAARHLPKDAHSRRSAISREVLLHAGDLGFRAFQHRSAGSECSFAGTSGIRRRHG